MAYSEKKSLAIGDAISTGFELIKDHATPSAIFVLLMAAREAIPMLLLSNATIVTPAQKVVEALVYTVFYGFFAAVVQISMIKIFLSRDYEQEGFLSTLGFSFRKLLPYFLSVIVFMLGVAAWSILLIIPGFMAMVRWIMNLPAIVDEDLGPVQAIRRSSELTKGYRWKIFGFLILVAILVFIVALVAAIPLFMAFGHEKMVTIHLHMLSGGDKIITQPAHELTMPGKLVMSFVNGVASLYFTASYVALYKALKRLHGGIDRRDVEAIFR